MSKKNISDLSIVDQVYECTKLIASGRNIAIRQDGWNRLVAVVKTGYGYKALETMLVKKGVDTPVYARQALAYVRRIESGISNISKLPA